MQLHHAHVQITPHQLQYNLSRQDGWEGVPYNGLGDLVLHALLYAGLLSSARK